ncbi:hypothetical protein J6590_016314 [Homalodisca vitripennis]|nr:hypothetical protein J6590_016314 [Homalodisca vitripennis]
MYAWGNVKSRVASNPTHYGPIMRGCTLLLLLGTGHFVCLCELENRITEPDELLDVIPRRPWPTLGGTESVHHPRCVSHILTPVTDDDVIA